MTRLQMVIAPHKNKPEGTCSTSWTYYMIWPQGFNYSHGNFQSIYTVHKSCQCQWPREWDISLINSHYHLLCPCPFPQLLRWHELQFVFCPYLPVHGCSSCYLGEPVWVVWPGLGSLLKTCGTRSPLRVCLQSAQLLQTSPWQEGICFIRKM